MKGAVFIAFNDMVESILGIDVWESLLEKTQPESKGIYTSVESYKDEELFNMVACLSDITKKPQSELVGIFGKSLFSSLNNKYPQFTAQQKTLFDFIESIDGTIHKEVDKLYMNAALPTIRCERQSDTQLTMYYSSPRKLCILAEGLIHGAANHYNNKCTIEHDQCMHKGDDECKLVLCL